jgi:hypothetical protein
MGKEEIDVFQKEFELKNDLTYVVNDQDPFKTNIYSTTYLNEEESISLVSQHMELGYLMFGLCVGKLRPNIINNYAE